MVDRQALGKRKEYFVRPNAGFYPSRLEQTTDCSKSSTRQVQRVAALAGGVSAGG
jgi:hypothetical protein